MAVMSKSDETQSGQLLVWQPREKRKGDGEKEEWRYRSLMISVYSTPILDPTIHVDEDRSNVPRR